MPFTPIQAVAGGLSIGLSTFWNARLNGTVTGISGILRSALSPNLSSFAFLAGLSTAGLALRPLLPAGLLVDVVTALPLSRLLPAGFLVGVGATLANGCTSGHAVSGLSRFSKRSFVSTTTFMAAGIVSCHVFNTAELYDLDAPHLDFSNIFAGAVPPPAAHVPWIGGTVLLSALVPYLIARMVQLADSTASVDGPIAGERYCSKVTSCVQEVLQYTLGFIFGSGLVVAGMALPQKVIAFLNVGAATWDPSLMFVFVGALPVAAMGFRSIIQGEKPRLVDKHCLPSRSDIDVTMVTGACLFGAGWGMVGLCPGPVVVYFGAFPQSSGIISFAASMIVGISASKPVLKTIDRWRM